MVRKMNINCWGYCRDGECHRRGSVSYIADIRTVIMKAVETVQSKRGLEHNPLALHFAQR